MSEQVAGNFMFDAATHRDFLGAILGTGIDRRTIGDILVQGEQGAQVLCIPEMVEYLESTLIQVWGYLPNWQAIVKLARFTILVLVIALIPLRHGRQDEEKQNMLKEC
jgi:hypothetical protein